MGLFSGAFGVRPFVVTGISMEPTLNAGDVVLVWERTDFADLAVGDVIKVRDGGFAYVHRIVSIGSDEEGPVVVTQGDSVARFDSPVRPEAVDGEVVVGIPWIGKPAWWVRDL
jgi:signal peptidase